MVTTSDDEWPICTRQTSEHCEVEVNPRRWSLGLQWCMSCADKPKQYCAVPMHKSNTVLVTNIKELRYVGTKTPSAT